MRTYSVKETAFILGLGQSTVCRLCASDRIKATQSGSRAHYVISSVAIRDFKSTLKKNPIRNGKRVRYGRPRKTHPNKPATVSTRARSVSASVTALSLVRVLKATIQTKLDKLCVVEQALVDLDTD